MLEFKQVKNEIMNIDKFIKGKIIFIYDKILYESIFEYHYIAKDTDENYDCKIIVTKPLHMSHFNWNKIKDKVFNYAEKEIP